MATVPNTATNNVTLSQSIAAAIGGGKSRKEIVKTLINSGLNPQDADSLVQYAASTHKAEIRKGAAKQLGFGALLFVLGAVITAATYSAAHNGGVYVVAYGPMIFGGVAVLRGLFRLIFA